MVRLTNAQSALMALSMGRTIKIPARTRHKMVELGWIDAEGRITEEGKQWAGTYRELINKQGANA